MTEVVALAIAVYGLLFLLFLGLLLKSNQARTVPTPFMIFCAFEIVGVWPATIFALATSYSLTDAYPVLVAGLGFAAVLSGFALTVATGICRPEGPKLFRDAPVVRRHTELSFFIAIVVVAAILVGLDLYLFGDLPPLFSGLLDLTRGSSIIDVMGTISAGREQATKGHYFGDAYRGQGIIIELTQIGWPYLAGLAAVIFAKTRRLRWLLLTAVLVVLVVFFIGGSAQRWQTIQALLFVGVILALLGRIKGRLLIGAVALILGIYLGMSALNPQYADVVNVSDPLEYVAAGSVQRIVIGYGIHNIDIINLIHDGSLDFGFGTIHFQKLLLVIPGAAAKDPESVFAYRLASLLDNVGTTFASETYLGWLYADLGLPGVVFVYFFAGIVAGLAQRWISSRPKGAVEVPALGILSFYFGYISLDGPISVAASVFVLSILYGIIKVIVGVVGHDPALSPASASPLPADTVVVARPGSKKPDFLPPTPGQLTRLN